MGALDIAQPEAWIRLRPLLLGAACAAVYSPLIVVRLRVRYHVKPSVNTGVFSWDRSDLAHSRFYRTRASSWYVVLEEAVMISCSLTCYL